MMCQARLQEWQAAAAEQGVIDTGEATHGVIEASMDTWWLDGCQNLVLTTAEQEFMQSLSLQLYPIFRYAKGNRGSVHDASLDKVPQSKHCADYCSLAQGV